GLPFVFLTVMQGAEILRCMAEQRFVFDRISSWQRVFLLVSLAVFSLHAWYFNRVLLYIKYEDSPEHLSKRAITARNMVPRMTGLFPGFAMTIACAVAAGVYASANDPAAKELTRLAWLCGWVTLGLYGVFLAHKRWFNISQGGYLTASMLSGGAPGDTRTMGTGLPRSTKIMIAAFTGFSGLLFVLFTASAVVAPQAVGTASILLLAGAGWISFGSGVVHLSRRYSVPLFKIILVWAIFCSLWNDNHRIREVKAASKPVARLAPKDHFDSWKESLPPAKAGKRRPVFIVAAEGGGIRAAYWTATVLGELQDSAPQFTSHLYGISGVSGGSLGATVFTTLLAQNQSTNIKKSAQDVLSHDFLAPTVAYMLYPDLMQRFCFLKFETLDRAKALEKAWEQGWADQMKNDAFAQPFQKLWSGSTNRVPALFLNGTMVETGHRVVISNLDVKKFPNVGDAYDGLSADVPVSTAAHLSARFTYISPAGLFTNGTHVVDGGYFENSGAATADDVLAGIDFGSEDECELFFIVITSQENAGKPGRILHEVIAPIRTLLNTRTARAAYSVGLLRGEWIDNDPIIFNLDLRDNQVALGWQLSAAARQAMDLQLQSKTNGANLKKVRELVRGE
ncbi:MAG TPA: patatin-like phospholipase family protein, partial [Verrucomicrobiae bacterium]|nr:patatin-like phospholipase family protein [Verrucomicrobiae bacterium]